MFRLNLLKYFGSRNARPDNLAASKTGLEGQLEKLRVTEHPRGESVMPQMSGKVSHSPGSQRSTSTGH
jgi:hypothetical protein